MNDFIVGASISAICWVVGSFVVGFVEEHKKDKANKVREKLAYHGTALATPQVFANIGKVEPQVRIGMMNAMNGRLLEVGTTTLNRHGDREFVAEYYIIDETKPLSEEIAVVMLMKGMSK
jgi:hypothetical protein